MEVKRLEWMYQMMDIVINDSVISDNVITDLRVVSDSLQELYDEVECFKIKLINLKNIVDSFVVKSLKVQSLNLRRSSRLRGKTVHLGEPSLKRKWTVYGLGFRV